jgi:hypothetical protein
MNPTDTEGFELMISQRKYNDIKNAIDKGYFTVDYMPCNSLNKPIYSMLTDIIVQIPSDILKYLISKMVLSKSTIINYIKILCKFNNFQLQSIQYKENILNNFEIILNTKIDVNSIIDNYSIFYHCIMSYLNYNYDIDFVKSQIKLLFKYGAILNQKVWEDIIKNIIQNIKSINIDIIIILCELGKCKIIKSKMIEDEFKFVKNPTNYKLKLYYDTNKEKIDSLYDLINLGIDTYKQKQIELKQKEQKLESKVEEFKILIRQKNYEGIKNAIDQGHISINIRMSANMTAIHNNIGGDHILKLLLYCTYKNYSIGSCKLENGYFIKYIPSNFVKYLIDKGLKSDYSDYSDYSNILSECANLNINDTDSVKQNILEIYNILIKFIDIKQFSNIIIHFIGMLYFDVYFFKSIINIFIDNGLVIDHTICLDIINLIMDKFNSTSIVVNINFNALEILFEYGKCAESLSQDVVLKKKFDNIKLVNNSMQKAIYLKFKNNIDSLYELIFMPADNKIIISDDLKTFAIKDQISLKHEILINKDMSKIINVIKSRYYDLLFELIEMININTYIYDNEVYKTILILAVENYAKDKQFDKMLILYLLKTANPNLCAYRQGIVEKIYDFNYTPVQLMIKHEDFDLILAMVEKGAILNLTKHFVMTKGLGFGVDFEMYLKLNTINVIIKCPLYSIKDDKIKDLLIANNCCGERSLLLDANV